MRNWKYIVLIIILVSPAYTKMSAEAKKACNQAQTCYSDMVANAGNKLLHTLKKEKAKCDGLKKECDRLLEMKDESHLSLDQALAAYKKAFERYTSMVTTSRAQDESTVQKALQEYRDSYTQYIQIKNAQEKSPPKFPKDNSVLDATGVDGIVDIDPSDVENNIAYIEGLRLRTEDQTQKSESTSLEASQQSNRCQSKEFSDLKLSAVEYFEKGKSQMALEQFKKAYRICPTDELKEMIGLLDENSDDGQN